MPNEKKEKLLCVESLRHSEYYNMQGVFDDLYARSKNGDYFDNLMEVILSPNNILLAYRNIKTNAGSKTPGTDRLNIDDIGGLDNLKGWLLKRNNSWSERAKKYFKNFPPNRK